MTGRAGLTVEVKKQRPGWQGLSVTELKRLKGKVKLMWDTAPSQMAFTA